MQKCGCHFLMLQIPPTVTNPPELPENIHVTCQKGKSTCECIFWITNQFYSASNALANKHGHLSTTERPCKSHRMAVGGYKGKGTSVGIKLGCSTRQHSENRAVTFSKESSYPFVKGFLKKSNNTARAQISDRF